MMARKKPLCARCGKPLDCRIKGYSHVMFEYAGLPGKPYIGWHVECSERDDVFNVLRNRAEDDRAAENDLVERMLYAIEVRLPNGAERVRRNKR